MMELEKAKTIARAVVEAIEPYCTRVEVVGSIRRRKPTVRDIDLVVITHDRGNLDLALMRMGNYKMSGSKIARIDMDGVQVDIYFADEETWATLVLIRTGSTESNIRLATLAKKRGWHQKANGEGLFNEYGEGSPVIRKIVYLRHSALTIKSLGSGDDWTYKGNTITPSYRLRKGLASWSSGR